MRPSLTLNCDWIKILLSNEHLPSYVLPHGFVVDLILEWVFVEGGVSIGGELLGFLLRWIVKEWIKIDFKKKKFFSGFFFLVNALICNIERSPLECPYHFI